MLLKVAFSFFFFFNQLPLVLRQADRHQSVLGKLVILKRGSIPGAVKEFETLRTVSPVPSSLTG